MPFPASGGAAFTPKSRKVIRMILHGCTNRPFYHFVVMEKWRRINEQCIEQLGTFDPLPNSRGEKLVALNLERLTYWIGQKCTITDPCMKIFGLAGFLPIHPRTVIEASEAREKTKLAKESENAEASSSS
ncbi:putative 28S ribosomal protein S16, mitochondrial [Armadillidium vulgare]|nr:putative 28S ribosomal protein S16, mitochondrial [Armadillidium vulgare]